MLDSATVGRGTIDDIDSCTYLMMHQSWPAMRLRRVSQPSIHFPCFVNPPGASLSRHSGSCGYENRAKVQSWRWWGRKQSYAGWRHAHKKWFVTCCQNKNTITKSFRFIKSSNLKQVSGDRKPFICGENGLKRRNIRNQHKEANGLTSLPNRSAARLVIDVKPGGSCWLALYG